MCKLLYTVAIACLLTFSSKAQESYLNGFAQNEISQVGSNPVVTESIGTGIMSVTAALPGSSPFFPSNLIVTFHELTGEMVWAKKHTFPGDLQVMSGVAVNNELHVVGLINRASGVNSSNRGAFSLVLTANGDVKYYEEIRLNNSTSSVGLLYQLNFDLTANTFYCSGSIFESGIPNTAIFKFDNAGKLIQVERLYTTGNFSTTVLVPGTGIFVFQGSDRILLDANLTPSITDHLQLNAGEMIYIAQRLSTDSVLLFTSNYSGSSSYSLIIWTVSSNTLERVMLLPDAPYRFQTLIQNGAAYYLATQGANRQSHYRLDATFDTLRTSAQVFGPNGISGFNSIPICDEELLSFATHPDTSVFYIGRSSGNWLFPQSPGQAAAITRVSQFIGTDGNTSLVPNPGNVAFTTTPVTPTSANKPVTTTTYYQNSNCTSLASLPATILACNQNSIPVVPVPVAKNCLRANTVRNYRWSNGDTEMGTTAYGSGPLTLIVDEGGCSDTLRTVVSFEYVDINAEGDNNFCLEQKDSAALKLTSSTDGVVYWLNTNPPSDSIYSRREGFLQAIAINKSGCSITGSFLVEEVCPPFIFIPNAFTPDGDGINDLAQAHTMFIEDVDFRIINRWGQVVHRTSNPSVDWNGQFNGVESPIGIYVWVIDYTPKGTNDRLQRVGHFCLVR